MERYIYKVKNTSYRNVFAASFILILCIIFIFCLIWILPVNDKKNYKDYKAYEGKINSKFNEIINIVNDYEKKYNSNELSKREIITEYKKYSKKLEKLYDSFTWKRGDIVTKGLYSIKKIIIINYAQIYYNKAVALESDIPSNEIEETEYINILIEQYNRKDKLQRQIYNIDF